eukprot:4936368-Heterocapsa_arctica.AAC.1
MDTILCGKRHCPRCPPGPGAIEDRGVTPRIAMAGRAPQPERLRLPFKPLESETSEGLGWNEVGQLRNLLALHN